MDIFSLSVAVEYFSVCTHCRSDIKACNLDGTACHWSHESRDEVSVHVVAAVFQRFLSRLSKTESIGEMHEMRGEAGTQLGRPPAHPQIVSQTIRLPDFDGGGGIRKIVIARSQRKWRLSLVNFRELIARPGVDKNDAIDRRRTTTQRPLSSFPHPNIYVRLHDELSFLTRFDTSSMMIARSSERI